MRIKRSFAGLAVMFSTVFVAAPGAMSLTFDEFDRLKSHQQESFIETALHYYYYGYTNNSETTHKAACMVSLENQKTQGGGSYLLSLIMRDLDFVRNNTRNDHSVEGVIKSVIERECSNL